MTNEELAKSLRIRAYIRRNASNRKSVQEGKPDRLADLLDLAASRLDHYVPAVEVAEAEQTALWRACWQAASSVMISAIQEGAEFVFAPDTHQRQLARTIYGTVAPVVRYVPTKEDKGADQL